MKKRLTTALATGVLVAALVPTGSTLAQDGTWTTVLDGLDAPRGLAFGPDGTLYVAVAGSGGDMCMEAPGPEGPELMQICAGPSGMIGAVDTGSGSLTPVVEGLPSVSISAEGVLGTADVAVDSMGDIFYLTGDGNDPDAAERAEGDIGGMVWRAADGMGEQLADLIAYEAAENPDGHPGLDSNPNGLDVTADGSILIADAGANSLLMLADGAVSTAATFADTMTEMPAMPGGEGEAAAGEEAGEGDGEDSGEAAEGEAMIPMQAVPTSVTVGPDGAGYVTFLTGFPFTPGAAWVARVVPGEDPTVYASGFTNAIGADFASDGTLYVLEMAHNGLLSGDPTGGLWSVPPGGGEATLVTTDGLELPGGIAISDDDEIFISNGSRFPGVGSIVKLNQ